MVNDDNREIEIDIDKRPIVNASEAEVLCGMVTQMKVWKQRYILPLRMEIIVY